MELDGTGNVSSVTVLRLGMSGPGEGSDTVSNGSAANTITQDAQITGQTYTSSGDDENALRIEGAAVTLKNIIIQKTGGESSNTENGDFYGANAGLLALSGAQVTINNATVNTSTQNGNGIFSYGEGTVVTIRDSKIRTTGDNSGGIQTTGGATTNAYNLDIQTQGNSSAAIRSDRGGGTVTVDGGTYETNGTGSPAVYSTANISVLNATLNANSSEAIVVEGKNSVTLENCTVTGNMTGTYQGDNTENIHNIMLYQSMSGDAEEGTSSFTATGGSITAKTGALFYVTNTHSIITLSDVDLTLANGKLLTVEGNNSSRGWGTAGENGGQVEWIADGQTLTGEVTVDTISTLKFTLKNASTFEGTINIVQNAHNTSAVQDNAVVTIEEGCTWKLTGNATLTSLTNNGSIDLNGYTITLADGTVIS